MEDGLEAMEGPVRTGGLGNAYRGRANVRLGGLRGVACMEPIRPAVYLSCGGPYEGYTGLSKPVLLHRQGPTGRLRLSPSVDPPPTDATCPRGGKQGSCTAGAIRFKINDLRHRANWGSAPSTSVSAGKPHEPFSHGGVIVGRDSLELVLAARLRSLARATIAQFGEACMKLAVGTVWW